MTEKEIIEEMIQEHEKGILKAKVMDRIFNRLLLSKEKPQGLEQQMGMNQARIKNSETTIGYLRDLLK